MLIALDSVEQFYFELEDGRDDVDFENIIQLMPNLKELHLVDNMQYENNDTVRHLKNYSGILKTASLHVNEDNLQEMNHFIIHLSHTCI